MRLRNVLAATAVSTLGLGAVGIPACSNTAPPPANAGRVVAWGDQDDVNAGSATITVPTDLTGPVTAVAANARATGVVTLDGRIRVWGHGMEVTEAPSGITDATALSFTSGHGAVLHADGRVEAWGTADALNAVPSELRAKAIALSGSVGYAVRPDGTLTTWGGQLATPLPASGLTDLVDVSASVSHALALRADGTVVSWGAAGLTTVPDFGGKKVVKIAAGDADSTVVFEDGTIDVWGPKTPADEPIFDGRTPAGRVVSIALAPSSPAAAAVTANGAVHTWGTSEDVAAVPASLTGKPVAAIALGASHAIVVVTTICELAEPTIHGTPEVGQTLHVTPPQYSLRPTSSTGQWLANSFPISGQTGSTLTLDDSLVGSVISYRTSATRDGTTVESNTAAATVTKATTTTKLTVTPTSARAGARLIAAASATRAGGTPTGKVTFKVGSTVRIVPLSGGRASWTLPSQAAGTRQVTASYSGSPTSTASSAVPVTIRISPAASKVKARAKANHQAKKVTLAITVTTGKRVSPSGRVTITLGGRNKRTVHVRVNINGRATLTVKNLRPGRYTAKLKYAGNASVLGSKGLVRFKI